MGRWMDNTSTQTNKSEAHKLILHIQDIGDLSLRGKPIGKTAMALFIPPVRMLFV